MEDHKLYINFCDIVDLCTLPDVGKKTAKCIARFRERNGNITVDTLEFVPKLRISKHLYKSIDFTPNPQYDYIALRKGIGDPGKELGEPEMDVIGRLTQALSPREMTTTFQERHISQTVYRGPHPLGRRGIPFSDKAVAEGSGSTQNITDIPVKNRFQGLTTDSSSEESNVEDFYDSLREVPYSRRPGVSKFTPSTIPKALCYDEKTTDLSSEESDVEDFYDSLREVPYVRRPGVSKFRPSTIPKALCYDGKTNWDNFKTKFIQYAKSCELSWKECQDVLCWCFTGKAADYHALITEIDPEADFATIFRKMEKQFGLKELSETAHARFEQAVQLIDEDLDDWADRILTLAGKAFKHLPEKHMVQQAVARFCQGCHDKEAGQSACNSRPRTMEQALDHIRWYQYGHQSVYGRPKGVKEVRNYDLDTSGSQSYKTNNHYDTTEEKHTVYQPLENRFQQNKSAPSGSTNDKESRIQSLEKGIAKIHVNLEKVATELSMLRRPQFPSNFDRVPLHCVKCGEDGHFERDCGKHFKDAKKGMTFSEDLNKSGSGKRA